MPAQRLDNLQSSSVPRFAVVGKYANCGQFVCHLALLRDGAELRFNDEVKVWQTCPPIVAGSLTSNATQNKFDNCRVHVIGYLDDLTADEIAGIETTLAEIDVQTPQWRSKLYSLKHYIVHPPIQWVVDQRTQTKRYRKFSCVGFVLECYSEGAGISLLDFNHPNFPRIGHRTLISVYGNCLSNKRSRERLGIAGQPPWPIALGGYVLHALNRSPSAVRASSYLPSSPQETRFP